MFISNLSREQQAVFLGLAKQLILSDSNLATEEESLLTSIQRQMESEVIPTDVPLNSLKELFPTRKDKASMLLELLGLAHADNDYHASEKEFVTQVARACGISKMELIDMECWVVRQLALVHEATQFMEG